MILNYLIGWALCSLGSFLLVMGGCYIAKGFDAMNSRPTSPWQSFVFCQSAKEQEK